MNVDAGTSRSRRSGGRRAHLAARAAGTPAGQGPVRAGLDGGQYRPLTAEGVARIHDAALEALDVIGLANAPGSGVEILTGAGALLGDDGRIRFPRALVEDMLAIAARDLTLCARDPAFDLDLSGTRVHFGTAGAAVHMVDPVTGDYRHPTVRDLHDAARLVQNLENVHFFQRPLVPREISDMYELDVNTIYACVSGTAKHIGTSFSDPGNVAGCIDLLHRLAGGEDAWRARPFVSNSNCFVVPPMRFATESCQTMESCVRAGMPVLLLSAGQAGATSPAPLATSIVQAVAECLAGVVYVNAIRPGHPAIFGTWPFVCDLRTGAMSGGSAELGLMSAGCAQMHRFYGLPGGAAAGISDSKMPDMQAGWEQGITNLLAGLSGLNMVYEAAGMQASLLGFCHESLVLGNDIIGQVLRCIRGIEVSEDSVSIEAMKSACLGGPGHYLAAPQTLRLMETEYLYPKLGNRMSPKEWEEAGRPMLIDSASARVAEILASADFLIPAEVDADVRRHWPIRL